MAQGMIKIKGDEVIIKLSDNEVWLTQHELADLFECFVSKVSSNIRSILQSGVLYESDVCRTCHYLNGNSVEQYNLEMIMALSFRIKSRNAETFRSFIMKKAVEGTVDRPIQMIGDGDICDFYLN